MDRVSSISVGFPQTASDESNGGFSSGPWRAVLKGKSSKPILQPIKTSSELIILVNGLSNLLELLKPFKHGVYLFLP